MAARAAEERRQHERVRRQREERAVQHMRALNKWDTDRMIKQAKREAQRQRVFESRVRQQQMDLQQRRAAVSRVRLHKQFVQATTRNHRLRETWHGKLAVPARSTLVHTPMSSTTYDAPGLNTATAYSEPEPRHVDDRYWQYLTHERVRDALQTRLRSTWGSVDDVVRRGHSHDDHDHSHDHGSGHSHD